MNVKIRDEICPNCPWRVELAHQLDKPAIIEMIANSVISPCHMEQEKVEGCTCNTGVEIYAEHCEQSGEPFEVCAGFAIARARAGNHGNNPMIKALNQQIIDSGDVNDPAVVGLDFVFNKD